MEFLGDVYVKLGRFEDALIVCQEVYDLTKQKLGPNHNGTLKVLHNLCSVYFLKRDYVNTITHLKIYIESAKKLYGANDIRVINASSFLVISARKALLSMKEREDSITMQK